MTLVDTHCHLGLLGPQAVEEAAAAGVGAVVDVGMGIRSSEEAAARAAAHPGRVYAAVGLHPNDLREFSEGAMARLAELAILPGVVAVGETGLDFYRDREPPARQEEAFAAHIDLARRTGKALVVHCRQAHARLLEVLDAEGAPETVVMHCFAGDADFARACARRGFFCSFAGNLTYPRSDALREAARVLPAELLLVETDAPYLAPQAYRGRPNTPAYLPETVRALGAIRGEALAERLTDNARRAFGLSRLHEPGLPAAEDGC